MTRAHASTVAHEMAVRFGRTFVVYRFPAWPPDVWGVIGRGRAELPPETVIAETVDPEAQPADQPALF